MPETTAKVDRIGKVELTPEELKKAVDVYSSDYVNEVTDEAELYHEKLNIDAIRKALPARVFEKNVVKSMKWILWDMGVVFLTLWISKEYVYKNESLPLMLKLILLPLGWSITGFFMWCIFVAGHDCGHGSFSEYKLLNFIMGCISHGSILVPFTAWARSHRLHHLNHNHCRKDYSFPWAHDPTLDNFAQRYLGNRPIFRSWFFPILGYFYYLNCPTKINGMDFGVDGNHYFPIRSEKMWKDASEGEIRDGWISSSVVLFYIVYYMKFFFENDLLMYFSIYVPSWFVFTYWLFTITYLQHHSENTKIFDDTTWQYCRAAFETVDRRYGVFWGFFDVDFWHHRISDCHVVHHIFFTKIPHYHLKEATNALVEYLKKEDLIQFYQKIESPKFYQNVFEQMYDFGTRAHLYTKDIPKYAELREKYKALKMKRGKTHSDQKKD